MMISDSWNNFIEKLEKPKDFYGWFGYFWAFGVSGIFHIPFGIAFNTNLPPKDEAWTWMVCSIPMLLWVYMFIRGVSSWGKKK